MLLYLHIPFCDSKCHYCAFNSYTDKHTLREDYMQAVVVQLQHEIAKFSIKENTIETLFIGGGTPSTIIPSLYEPFFNLINPYLKKDAEITTEANPNSGTLQWLKGMKNLGVNRVSFGVQSFNNKKLKLLGRNHTKDLAINAINNAKSAGFTNISLDLIYGTLGDTKEILKADLEQAFLLPINHLSAYSLTIEEGTKFFNTPEISVDDEDIAFWFTKQITKQGFQQYEISNFGTYQSKHNLGYWQYKNYLGIGSGAVGFLENKRFYPTQSIEKYIKNPFNHTEELLDEEAIKSEKILLGFRSIVGVALNLLTPDQQKKAMDLVQANKISLQDGKLFNKDFFLSDELALYILG